MYRKSQVLLLSLFFFSESSIAANDWSKPCLSGWCSWETGDGKKTAFSSLVVNGGSKGLSDITTAAGWNITGCNANWDKDDHNVTLTCADKTTCNHLFDGGAENTVVRLPPECGKGPFAVMKACQSTDGKTKNKRDVSNGQKWAATLSYNFASVPPNSDKGPIKIFLSSSNVKSASQVDKRWAEELLRKRGRDEYLYKRGFFDDIGNAIKGGAQQVADKVTQAAGAVATGVQQAEDGAKKAADDAKTAAQAVASAAQQVTKINQSQTKNLDPITFKKNVPIFDKSIDCGTIKADLNMNMDATVNAKVAYGFTIIGTAVPPKLDEFNLQASMNGDVDATFNVNMALQGNFDTGVINVFKQGLPGLSVAGIATIGPELSIGTELGAEMNIEAQMSFNTAFKLPNVNFAFPPDKTKSTADGTALTPAKNPLKISAGNSNVTGTGSLDAHLIPRLDFGLDLLGGFAKATVFIQVDAGATLSMQIDAAKTAPPPPPPPPAPKPREISRVFRRADPPPPPTSTVSGEVALDGSIFIDGGLQGALGNLFSKSLDFNIFQFTGNIFDKTFGTPPKKREERRSLKKAIAGKAKFAAQLINMKCFGGQSLLDLGANALPGFLSKLLPLPL